VTHITCDVHQIVSNLKFDLNHFQMHFHRMHYDARVKLQMSLDLDIVTLFFRDIDFNRRLYMAITAITIDVYKKPLPTAELVSKVVAVSPPCTMPLTSGVLGVAEGVAVVGT
jgi:hypothetical protein